MSPKGYSELIFPDANCSIRRTGQQFQYQLVVQRVYEEGEEELAAGEEDGDGAAAGLSAEKDEKTFLLDESLQFKTDSRDGGEIVFSWRDLSGDPGDSFEFVCEYTIQPPTVAAFESAAVQCQFERKYRRSHETATEEELEEFVYGAEPSVAEAPAALNSVPAAKTASTMPPKTPTKAKQAGAAPSIQHPASADTFVEVQAELHLFDIDSGTFVEQDHEVTATVYEVGSWKYWMSITGKSRDWLGMSVEAELNPTFNPDYLSFIFNHYTPDGSAFSWLLRFKDLETYDKLMEGFMRALWEHLNEARWLKVKDQDREYAMEAYQEDVEMKDAPPIEEEEEEPEEEEEQDDSTRSEYYDEDEDQDDVEKQPRDKEVNSQLAVGFKNDRTFVVRGNKIGVFKHGNGNNLDFQTSINKIATPNGKAFSPKKVMLHAEDRDMILQNPGDANSLYRMDIEYGKVVDEYKVHDDIPITTFAPEKKFAQMTGEQTFIGTSHNALYRVDPRLSGNKMVDSELKQYASKNGFTSVATTAAGYIAVASDKGDVRMFDRLGINAKTHIPALGDPIKGLDVSADGRWVLATTRTYLLLIDAEQKHGKNAGKLGFEKSFAKDDKPRPRRLALSPAHVAQLTQETRAGIDFTPARFNTGENASETTIVTASGPFVIAWSMKKVLRGAARDAYTIKRYAEQVKADDFRYGSDRNFIVALENQVGMERKSALQRPTRESIVGATPRKASAGGAVVGSPYVAGGAVGRLSTPARRSNLRDEIVNSPY